MASHLETLIHEYLEWQGYLVRRNVKVGRRAKGGWEMELDLIGYNPTTMHLVHYEPSLDAFSWDKRELRFKKKFSAAEKYLFLRDISMAPCQLEAGPVCGAAEHLRALAYGGWWKGARCRQTCV